MEVEGAGLKTAVRHSTLDSTRSMFYLWGKWHKHCGSAAAGNRGQNTRCSMQWGKAVGKEGLRGSFRGKKKSYNWRGLHLQIDVTTARLLPITETQEINITVAIFYCVFTL